MRSFARRGRVTVATLAAWLLVCLAAEAQTVRERFDAALERDEKVRALLAASQGVAPPPDLTTQLRQALAAFETIVRRFPTSGYADNALAQGASLAESAYARFGRADDRERAIKLHRWLVDEYPTSPLVKPSQARLALLANAAAPPQPARARATASASATLTRIDRTVMTTAVRVTLELDREVEYFEQRLTGPARVFFDLRNVQLSPGLVDTVLSYPSDVVNKIRTGRHPDQVARVVLDLEDVEHYSVFTLYSPFRLVIDAERTAARQATVVVPLLPSRALPLVMASIGLSRPPVTAVIPVIVVPEPPPPPATAVAVVTASTVDKAAPAPPPPTSSAAPAAPQANVAGGFSIARQLGLSVSRIVIDPGHGGHDPGVLGKGLTESALVLDVALRLEKLLQKEPGVEVVLTRRTDVYVPLEERTEIANRQNADMFLSIHANASRNIEVRGIETFFLSFASSPDAESVAARENSASAREMHQLPDLIKAITLNNKLDESRDLANMVQEALVANLRKTNKEVRSRGVKKAPFVVLIGAEMPSVLAEISFVSNRQELALLKTPAYRQKIAESLYNAVSKYRKSLKNQTLTALPER